MQWGVKEIHVLSVLASSKGLSELLKYHPDVHVTVGHIDEKLNDDGDIVPGKSAFVLFPSYVVSQCVSYEVSATSFLNLVCLYLLTQKLKSFLFIFINCATRIV